MFIHKITYLSKIAEDVSNGGDRVRGTLTVGLDSALGLEGKEFSTLRVGRMIIRRQSIMVADSLGDVCTTWF